MSADNWAKCPKCKIDDALREDYDIGIYEEMLKGPRGDQSNFKFGIEYYAQCSACNFKFSHTYEEWAK